MSTAEPVSAYSAFRSAKGMADAKNKNKNKKNNKNSPAKQNKKKTQTAAKSGAKATTKKVSTTTLTSTTSRKKSNLPTIQSNKPKTTNSAAAANKNKPKNNVKTSSPKSTTSISQFNFDDEDIASLVEELMGDPSKKLNKSQLKKKKELEAYLIQQMEQDTDNPDFSGDDDDYDSESGDEEDFSGSDEYSDEYTINESGSFSSDDEMSGDESSSNMSVSSVNENGRQSTLNKSSSKGVKRKSTQIIEHRKTVSGPQTNGVSEGKKSKAANERKSLPAQSIRPKATKDANNRRKSVEAIVSGRKASITKASVKLEPLTPAPNIVNMNSIEEGKRVFQWLINPVKVEDFMDKYWESKACLIKRQQGSFFSHLISFEGIDQMLIKNHVEFTKNIDITSYKNGIRETLNPEGRAMPPVVWDHYGQGCSIRLLNPQTFLPNLYSLCTTMQEYFHCLVGANAYLTPPNSQGFAPHYDDIEAFVLQIEGRKRWKLYKPRNVSELLPRYSSHNFNQNDIGKPILEEVLQPGDVLYFPRGTIHQACTEPGHHSLHITLSVYQKQSYADLFEKMIPMMLQKAIASNVHMRKGLPLNVWHNAGIAFSDVNSRERNDFRHEMSKLMQKCLRDMPLMDIADAAIDQCAKKFQHEALPPEILPSEKIRTVFGSHSRPNERGDCVCDYNIDERTNIRLLRANILRLVEEEKKIRIYYYLDNSKEYCEYEPNFIEIEATEAASIEVLAKSYPSYIGVSQLPLPSDDNKVTLATALWERGLLMTEKPFK